jgi:hypothetical protein
MGRLERRTAHRQALKCLRELDSYVLVGINKGGPPRCYFDVSQCTSDKDVRHQFMVHMRTEAQIGVNMVLQFARKNKAAMEEEIRVKHFKEQRSADLAKETGGV